MKKGGDFASPPGFLTTALNAVNYGCSIFFKDSSDKESQAQYGMTHFLLSEFALFSEFFWLPPKY